MSGGDGPDAEPDAVSLHATCLVVGETGILITGASGSGKTSLALEAIRRALAAGRFARLVADDRVRLEQRHGRLVARPHPAIAGRVEIRGLGIGPVACEPACVVGLAVMRDETASRFPDPSDRECELLGLRLPVLRVGGGADPATLMLARLEWLERAFHDTPVTIT